MSTHYSSVSTLVGHLHNLLPAVLGIYFLAALAISACSLQKVQDMTGRERLQRKSGFLLMLVIALTYITEAALIITHIFTSQGPLATRDSNIYALSSTLLWVVLIAPFVSDEPPKWWPFYSTWICALFTETLLFGCLVSFVRPSNPLERGQFAVKIIRIVFLIVLPTSYFFLSAIDKGVVETDEESAPLLGRHEVQSEDSPSSGYGSTTNNSKTSSAPCSDDEEAEESKKRTEKLKKLQNRLRENGNWLNYFREFTIFLPHIWPEKRWDLRLKLAGVGICIIVIRFLHLLVPRQLGILVNALNDRSAGLPFTELGIYIILSLANSYAGISTLESYLCTPIELYARKSLTTASYNHIMTLSCDFHDNKSSGELYTAMDQGQSMIDLVEMIAFNLVPMLVDLALACGYLYVIFDGYMAVIVAGSIICYLWLSAVFIKVTSAASRRSTRIRSKETQVMYDYMGGWKTVISFNRLDHAKEKYNEIVSQGAAIRYLTYILYYMQWCLTRFALDIGLSCASFYAIYQIFYGNQSVGSFVTLLSYWTGLTAPLYTLVRAHRDILNNLIKAEELLELYKKKPSVSDGYATAKIDKGEIRFEQVTFSYDGKKDILKDINFHASAGQTVALIGETGGGKSTILKLLFRFYDVAKGKILIDGHDVRDLTLESLREHIGMVPQDPTLFNDTVMNNVRYARLDANDDEVMDACKAAAVHDKIMTFTDKYESKVGERGVKLSGGELQRIAIARAILMKPKIILLDEATSAVDSITEGHIQEGLKKLSEGRTTFVVAHRLSTIANADLVLVIKDGMILEQGPPKQLLRTKGKYWELWSKQMGLDADKSKAKEFVSFTNSEESTEAETDSVPQAILSVDGAGIVDAAIDGASCESTKSGADSSSDSPTKSGFRPDAPEFVPLNQKAPLAKPLASHQSTQSPRSQGGDVIDTNAFAKRAKKPNQSRRKAKQNDQASGSSNHGDSSEGAESQSTVVSSLSKIIQDSEPKTKKSRFSRRKQTKSEPGRQDLSGSRGDGESEHEAESADSSVGLSAATASRRVLTPSDPLAAGPSQATSRRERHWRARHRGDSSAGAANISSGTVAPVNTPVNGIMTPTYLTGNLSTATKALSSNGATQLNSCGSSPSAVDTNSPPVTEVHFGNEA